jgi:CRISPR-associated protein Csx17
MSDDRPIDWSKTTFDGSRREQLRQAQRMTVRRRLEALDELTELSERLQAMARGTAESGASEGGQEPRPTYRTGASQNDIVLDGCTPTPLANYLKALGVLRLLSAKHPDTRGFWCGDKFVLRTTLTGDAIADFFLNEYAPTPIISPWSGRAGFLEGGENNESKRKGATILNRVEQAKGGRFSPYQVVISAVRNVSVIKQLDEARAERKVLEELKGAKKIDRAALQRLSEVKREEIRFKGALLLALRGELDDSIVPWIDACFALSMGERTPSPLLGSGGNEGSMDFSINHVGYLLELIDENTDEPTHLGKHLLANSLFGCACPLESSSNIGFLNTLATGGVNMSAGFEGGSSGNIWDSVLAMEGAILFASTSTKRLQSTASGRPSFPFAVSPSFAGSGSLAAKESARPELWLPHWNKPVKVAEIAALLAEGRVTKGKLQARNGVDMLEALSSLGAERGICAFNRFGFYERRGKGYYVAAHLGRFKVAATFSNNWMLANLNQGRWLDHFRKFSQGDNTPDRFGVLRKRLEDMLFALAAREPGKADAQALVTLLGEVQLALSSSRKAMESVCPIPRLSERWVMAADDGTPAFRIAKALSGLRGVGEESLPLRAQLFPVHRTLDQWVTSDADGKAQIYTDLGGRLTSTLRALLERRLGLAEKLEMRDKPLDSAAGVALEDISAFLRDGAMDERIAALLPGLSLCEIPRDIEHGTGPGAVPAAFALLKLNLTPDRILRSLGLLPEDASLPVPVSMLARLAAGNHGNGAVQAAWRRLRASGLAPIVTLDALPAEGSISPLRASAALLIPLRYGATATLARDVLKPARPKAT